MQYIPSVLFSKYRRDILYYNIPSFILLVFCYIRIEFIALQVG